MHADLSGKYVQIASELGKPQEPVNYLWFTGWPDGQATECSSIFWYQSSTAITPATTAFDEGGWQYRPYFRRRAGREVNGNAFQRAAKARWVFVTTTSSRRRACATPIIARPPAIILIGVS